MSATSRFYKPVDPNSQMRYFFRVVGNLNGNSCVLFTSEKYQKAESFCNAQDCPFELKIEKIWMRKSTEIKFDTL